MEKLAVNEEFWKDKVVLVTGHTGFKGSWLTIWLKKLGAKVIGFSKDIPTTPSLFELANVKNGMNSIIGDVRNFDEIKKVIEREKPEIVIHMAAQSLVQISYDKPRETYETNIMGTVNLLESLRGEKNTRVIVNVTSDKCYENRELERGYTEKDRIGGYDPYSSSKGCSELVTTSYRNSYFNPLEFDGHKVALASVRAGNVIGGGDWAKNRLIPDLMRSIIDGVKVKIRNAEGIRPWQHVLEPLNGYLLLMQYMWVKGKEYSDAWNFGPNEESRNVSWIIDSISKNYGKNCNISMEESTFHETKLLRLDCTKAHKKLGWKPKMSLEQGLKMTVDWYKEYEKKNDMKKFTEKQIDEFSII